MPRLGAEQPDALPFRKCCECRVRRSADEVDGTVAQRLVRLVDRKDKFECDVEPFALEKSKLNRRSRRKI